jgi:putative DNA primase/helicase
MVNNRNEYIKYYALGGLKIFPCEPNGKKPITTNGYKDATTNPNQIDEWWGNHPDANIGLVTGKDANLVVVDVDVKDNAGGMESLEQLESECGQFDTLMVHSPSGGRHYYFKYPQGGQSIGCRTNLRPGIDIRANGGYIIAAGSIINGIPYQFEDKDKEIAELPNELLKILTKANTKPKGLSRNQVYHASQQSALMGIKKGRRDDTIFKHSCVLRKNDVPYDIAESKVLTIAHNCIPPFPDHEAIKCLQSAYSSFKPKPKNPTDVGNAERLIATYGDDIRYVYEYRSWIHWDNNIWVTDENGHMDRLAKKVAKSIFMEAIDEEDEDLKKRLFRHADSTESLKRLGSMVSVATTEKGITISQSALDDDKYLLGVKNGIVDLKTGELIPSTKSQMITKRTNVTFDADAQCPVWENALSQMMAGDKDVVEYLQRAVGYSLTGDTREHLLFFLHGFGENGKSVFINIIQKLLYDYAAQTPVSTIMKKAKGSIPNDIARLKGARFVSTTETEEDSHISDAEIKHMTGGDIVTARYLHKEFFEFIPQFKLWISGNYKPILGEDHGIWRRLVLVPFEVTFDAKTRDDQLEDKLINELPGILNWAIEGCLNWQNQSLKDKPPKKILDATNEYKSDNDRIDSWTYDCCEKDASFTARSSELYESFRNWATSNSETGISHRTFSQKMVERKYGKKRTNKCVIFTGIRLEVRQ